MKKGTIIILCGESGSGKTTLLLNLLEQLANSNLMRKGILSPPELEDGQKKGINLLNVFTGEECHFAAPNDTGETKLATHGWKMDPKAVDYARETLKQATPCDILFVDELGPLEFNRGEGLMEGFSAIDSRSYHLAFVTIRPSLLESALGRWPDAKVVNVTGETRDILLTELLELVQRIKSNSTNP